MTSPVRSRRLFGPLVCLTAGTDIYTVPVGRTAIVRSFILVNNGAQTMGFELAVTPPVGSGTIWRVSLPTTSSVAYPSEMVLNPGDKITGYAHLNLGATVNPLVVGYGSLLMGAPT